MENKLEKLIEMVKVYPFLYDKSKPGYKNILLKEKTWKEIAKTLASNEAKVKRKWKGMRDSYFREVKKQCLPSRSDADGEPKWKYFESLKFLSNIPHAKRKNNNLNQTVETKHDFELIDEKHFSEDELFSTLPPLPTSTNTSQPVTENPICLVEDDFCHILKNLLVTSHGKDDAISLFFESTTHMIRNANLSPKELIELKIEILTLIKDKIGNKIKIE